MKRRSVSVNVRRFGYRNPHELNSRVGYRGGIRL